MDRTSSVSTMVDNLRDETDLAGLVKDSNVLGKLEKNNLKDLEDPLSNEWNRIHVAHHYAPRQIL